jgi:predicted PhzF superfamily epimerase YddE/YHI9
VSRSFAQVDVFTTEPYSGNPVAVALDRDGLSTEAMQRFAHWIVRLARARENYSRFR